MGAGQGWGWEAYPCHNTHMQHNCVCVHVYVLIHCLHTHTHTHAHMHIRTHTHTRTHAHTHTHTHTCTYQLVGHVSMVPSCHAFSDGRFHQTRERWENIDWRVHLTQWEGGRGRGRGRLKKITRKQVKWLQLRTWRQMPLRSEVRGCLTCLLCSCLST